ncbi:plasmid replication/partition related protein [Xylophilus rhododendri]|uniref:Plasmid replication/partition related protein n=1 Tax=Xylophilus rhododendri TaxID=2697032 RepID=A0A857JAI3_9BURK|nr:plasmid replication/partition related protein [Xylophilus rhododendri]QHJ01015.1 plasmid replication/partition related protein [Xylophilus rhododendri]
MNIVVNEELKAYIDPLTAEEHDALERSLLAEGCRDALVLWGDVLVDGHNRYGICTKHGLPFNTVQNTRFQSMEDVHLWMIDQHLGRRSVSDFQRGVLALRKKEIESERKTRSRAETTAPQASAAMEANDGSAPWDTDGEQPAAAVPTPAAVPAAPVLDTREAVARAARLSSAQVAAIEKIQKQAAPELVAAVRSGTISINNAAVVASLPVDEQVAAAVAGKDELKQAAKRVRDAKKKPREESEADSAAAEDQAADMVLGLRRRVEELTAENEALRAEVAELREMLG